MRLTINSLDDLILLIVGVPAFFMMMVTSRGFTVLKIVLLGLLTLICFLLTIVRKRTINVTQFKYVLLFVIYYSLSLIYGIISGYKFDINEDYVLIQYYILTPFIILFVSTELSRTQKRVDYILYFLQIITVFIVIMDVWKILSYRHILPDIDYFNLFYISSSVTTTELSLRISNEYALIYLIPFFTVLLFLNKEKKGRILNLIILIFGVVYSVLSGRKTLELVVFSTIGLMVVYTAFKKKKIKPLLIAIFAFVLLFIIFRRISNALDIGNIIQKALDTIKLGLSSDAYGVVKRNGNIYALFDFWLHSPVWGNGLNSYAVSSLANRTNYWSYEVVYNALLAQTGLVGIGMLFGGVFYICHRLFLNFKSLNNPIYLATLFGFSSFILSGATNPLVYIAWPWIVTLVILNCKCNEKMN